MEEEERRRRGGREGVWEAGKRMLKTEGTIPRVWLRFNLKWQQRTVIIVGSWHKGSYNLQYMLKRVKTESKNQCTELLLDEFLLILRKTRTFPPKARGQNYNVYKSKMSGRLKSSGCYYNSTTQKEETFSSFNVNTAHKDDEDYSWVQWNSNLADSKNSG